MSKTKSMKILMTNGNPDLIKQLDSFDTLGVRDSVNYKLEKMQNVQKNSD